MSDDPLMGVPLWYKDIFPQGEFDGFYRKLGNHAVNYIERDPNQLVITFDNLAEAGGRHYARDAWATNNAGSINCAMGSPILEGYETGLEPALFRCHAALGSGWQNLCGL